MPLHALPLDDLIGWVVGATAPRPRRRAVVVVDLDDDTGWDSPDLPPGLPHVVVGTTADDDPTAHPAAATCDVVLHPGDEATLAAVAGTVERSPLASLALVDLLRSGAGRSLEEGLVAESRTYSALQAGPEFARWRAATPRRRRGPEGDPVRLEREGTVLRIALARPHVRNALDAAMREALLDALLLAELDHGIERVELRGEGPDFCSGGDLDEFGTFESPEAAHELRVRRSVGRALAGLRDRVVVHLHGACAGSGIELPCFAGHVVAAPDTRIWLPELALGLIPGAGGTVSLTARAGRHRTAQLALSGTPVGAATAAAWGLVDELAP